MNSGILIDTFTGTTIRASPDPELTAVGVNAHNSHRMHLLGMKFVNPAISLELSCILVATRHCR
jgi:hypothetical protein